jgi:PadR family transcriptional regulator, regulatory protein PadR
MFRLRASVPEVDLITVFDYANRNDTRSNMKDVEREILLSFWKVHILHHAGKEPVVGQWIIRELRRHGYEVSPGTLYPLLARMEERGWLRCKVDRARGPRARKEYSLTRKGAEVLAFLRQHVMELYQETVLDKGVENQE